MNGNGAVSDKDVSVYLGRNADNVGAVADKNGFPLGIGKGSVHGILLDNDGVV